MSKNNVKNIIVARVNELETEQLKLFHSYNRHAHPDVKLKVLHDLSGVIFELKVLNNIQKDYD